MTKVLRRYRNWFLALFGSFLMVSFLLTGPSSVFHPDPKKTVEGTLNGEKVRADDFAKAATELDAVELLAPLLVKQNLGIKDGRHWLMLTREAQDMGLVGNQQDGQEAVKDIASTMLPDVLREEAMRDLAQNQPQMWDFAKRNPQILNYFVNDRLQKLTRSDVESRLSDLTKYLESVKSRGAPGLTAADFDLALAKLRGVLRMQNAYLSAGRLSDRRYIHTARMARDAVVADALVIPGATQADPAFTPTDEQIQAQFEKYKAVNRATSEDGFGYELPARVKLEWIEFNPATIASGLTLDLKDVSKHWQQHRVKFPGDIEAERANVERDLRNERVNDILTEVERAWKAKVKAELRSLKTVQNAKVLPADWASKHPTMQSLASSVAEAAQASLKFPVPTPSVQLRSATWLKVAEAGTLPGIGQSELSAGGKVHPFAEVLSQTYEISDDASLGVQVNVPFESGLVGADGSRHYFMVTDARKVSPPDSIEEVRDQVVSDLRSVNGFERAKEKITDYIAKAAGEGMTALETEVNASITDPGVSRVAVRRNARFTLNSTGGQLNLAHEEAVRDEALAIASRLGVLTEATDANQSLRTGSATCNKDHAVVVLQVVGNDPLTQEDLRSSSTREATQLAVQELARADEATSLDAADAFSPDAVAKRMNWKPAFEQKSDQAGKEKAGEKVKDAKPASGK